MKKEEPNTTRSLFWVKKPSLSAGYDISSASEIKVPAREAKLWLIQIYALQYLKELLVLVFIMYDTDGKNKIVEREDELFPEGVLCLLIESFIGDVTPWVKKLCENHGKKKCLRPKITIALQNIIKTFESLWLSHSMPIKKWTAPAGTWFLLSEVPAFLSKSVDWAFLHHQWQLPNKHEEVGQSKCSLGQEELDGRDGI